MFADDVDVAKLAESGGFSQVSRGAVSDHFVRYELDLTWEDGMKTTVSI